MRMQSDRTEFECLQDYGSAKRGVIRGITKVRGYIETRTNMRTQSEQDGIKGDNYDYKKSYTSGRQAVSRP